MKKIQAVQHHTNWKLNLTMTIIPDKEEAINDIAQDDPDLKIFTNGSGMNDKIGTSMVLYRDNRCKSSLQYQLGHISHHTVYEGEATGILLATNLILRELHVHTTIIYIDSRALTLATILTSPSPGHYIIDAFHSATLKALARYIAQTHRFTRPRNQPTTATPTDSQD